MLMPGWGTGDTGRTELGGTQRVESTIGLNQQIFLLINAKPFAGPPLVDIAVWLSAWIVIVPICAVALVLLVLAQRRLAPALWLLAALLIAAGTVSLLNELWPQARPFVDGIGSQLAPHVPDPSFPSHHASVTFTLALGILFRPGIRILGVVLLLWAAAVSWARIYLGVHWPLDILGGFGIALILAGLSMLLGSSEPPRRPRRYNTGRFN